MLKNSKFADRLRELRQNRNLTQEQLATKLGIGRTTIANYEKDIRYPGHETLIHIANYLEVSLDYLVGLTDSQLANFNNTHSKSNKLNTEEYKKQFCKFLLNKNHINAYDILLKSIKHNLKLVDIYQKIIIDSLNYMDDLCIQNRINIAQRDYFITTTENLISQIYPFFAREKQDNRIIVAATIEGEFHSFAIQMISYLLEAEGLRVIYLGDNKSSQTILKTLKDFKPELLILSATMYYSVENLKSLISTINDTPGIDRPKILVGGPAFNRDNKLWEEIGADFYAKDLSETLKLTKKIFEF